jgi:hypothetical protein
MDTLIQKIHVEGKMMHRDVCSKNVIISPDANTLHNIDLDDGVDEEEKVNLQDCFLARNE